MILKKSVYYNINLYIQQKHLRKYYVKLNGNNYLLSQ